jgi:hypothetical protein
MGFISPSSFLRSILIVAVCDDAVKRKRITNKMLRVV